MADGELKDMEYFFSTLPTPFTAFDTEAYKTSVVGELYISLCAGQSEMLKLLFYQEELHEGLPLFFLLRSVYETHAPGLQQAVLQSGIQTVQVPAALLSQSLCQAH